MSDCDVTWEDPTADHVHTCADFPDHSAGHHLCAICGWIYPVLTRLQSVM